MQDRPGAEGIGEVLSICSSTYAFRNDRLQVWSNLFFWEVCMNDSRGIVTNMLGNGVLFVVLGILCIIFRNGALTLIALFAGVGFLIAGITGISTHKHLRGSWGYEDTMLPRSVVYLVLGILFVLYPFALRSVLPWFIGISVLIAGLFEVARGGRLQKVMPMQARFDLMIGAIAVIFGLLMVLFPGMLAVFIGVYLLLYGLIMMVGGMFARSL